MQVDLPELAERVGLDEVPFVVDMESGVDGLALDIRDEAGHIDDCHALDTTVVRCEPFQSAS